MTRAAIIVAAVVGAIASSFWAGWNYGRADLRADVADAYAKTIKEIENADIPSDPAAIRCRLRELAGLGPCDL